MATWRVYISPQDEDGIYLDYVNVTDLLLANGIGKIKRRTESNEYDVGTASYDSVALKLNNSEGKFSKAPSINTIFPYIREGALVKVSYLFGEYAPICGIAVAGVDVLGPEYVAFEGLLTEKNIKQNVIDDTITMSVLGKESYFDNYESSIANITDASLISEAIYNLLNVGSAYSLFDIDLSNINPTLDTPLSSINSDATLEYLTEQTAKEAVDLLLESSNSVMYIENNVLYVTNRYASTEFKYQFYGQAATLGIENIQNISDYKSGVSRTFNFWKWDDTTLTAKELSSIATNGVLKHEDIDFEATTIPSARQLLLNSYRDEFSFPKVEMKLTTPVILPVLELLLFDKVSIDYPNIPVPVGLGNIPIWGTSSMTWQDEDDFDQAKPFFVWPEGLFNIEISPNQEWKIIGIDLDTSKDLATFELREV